MRLEDGEVLEHKGSHRCEQARRMGEKAVNVLGSGGQSWQTRLSWSLTSCLLKQVL